MATDERIIQEICNLVKALWDDSAMGRSSSHGDDLYQVFSHRLGDDFALNRVRSLFKTLNLSDEWEVLQYRDGGRHLQVKRDLGIDPYGFTISETRGICTFWTSPHAINLRTLEVFAREVLQLAIRIGRVPTIPLFFPPESVPNPKRAKWGGITEGFTALRIFPLMSGRKSSKI